MVHCQTVANTYCEKFKGNAARVTDTVLNATGNFVQMSVTGNIIACRANYCNKGLIHFAVDKSQRLKESLVWCAVCTAFD